MERKPDPRLVDAMEMAKANPDTFQATPSHRIELLVEGCYAKVCLEDEDSGERFWVEVTGPPLDGVYPGKVANQIGGWGLSHGAALYFEARHIYDTRFPGE